MSRSVKLIFLCAIVFASVSLKAPASASPRYTESTELDNRADLKNETSDSRGAPCQCGSPVPRIVNGELAKINDIPWTVGLVRANGGRRPFCGGTLINDRYILTASHCVDQTEPSEINVLLNEQDLLLSTETIGETKAVPVEKIIMHPNYNRLSVDNDVALIKLEKPETLAPDSVLIPACLPANNLNDFSGLDATVAGWGATSEGGSTSSSLRKVTVPIISNLDCNLMTRYFGRITGGMLCAGLVSEGGKDSCQGDSGGPLIIDNGNRKTLVGIVSWGYGCSQRRAPGVYSRVGKYMPWILENAQGAEWCNL